MYEPHFGLSAPPFQLTPDPGFFFEGQGHRAALRALRETMVRPSGHLVISGEIGAGKTLVVAALVEGLDSDRFVVARLVSTQLGADDVLRIVAGACGFDAPAANDASGWMRHIDARLRQLAAEGRRMLVVVDEAQNLDDSAFQRLAELDALPANAHGGLAIALVGQPEVRERLAQPQLAAFAARIVTECHLGPLSLLECGAYIAHRLERAGWTGRPAFDADAIDAIHRFTDGIPRRINQLCNRLMLAAFLQGLERVDRPLVGEVTAELVDEIGNASALSTAAPTLALRLPPEPAQAEPPPASPPPPMVEPLLAPLDAPASQPGTLSLNLLPIEDLLPSTLRAELREEEHADRFPAFAPWPSVPAVPPPLQGHLSAVENTIDLPMPRAPRILCVAGGVSEHAQAAVLLRAMRAVPTLPGARLVRAFANDAFERTAPMFYPSDAERLESLDVAPAGSHAERAAELLARFDAFLERQPAEVVVVFDGGEAALACALAASRRKIPVLRVGAGRRAKDSAVSPGDLKRKLSDQMADMLYTADAAASAQVARDGLPPTRVSMVGSVLADAIQFALQELAGPRLRGELGKTVARVGRGRAGYAVALLDAREHLQDRRVLAELVTMLAEISRDVPVLWPMPSSTREQLIADGLAPLVDRARIVVLPLQPYADFVALVSDATCVVTDAWTLQEESTILEVPCITVGTLPAHPTTLGEGSNVFVGMNRALATRIAWDCIFSGGKRPVPPRLWEGRAADRVAVHLAGWLSRERAVRA